MYSTKFIILQIVGLLAAIYIATSHPTIVNFSPLLKTTVLCPNPDFVETFEHEKTQYLLHDKEFRQFAVERFSRAIQIDTVVDEQMEDFSKFEEFHEYLANEFPLVFQRAILTKVNEYGLLFEFPGTDSSLKPVLLMAHQDTVPFGELSDWTHDPLSGDFDDEKIYGRGTNDVKGLLVGIMGAMDEILKTHPDYEFKRTIIFSFGYDEEITGLKGAKHLSNHIFEKYGPKSIDHVIDEGAPMFLELKENKFGFVVVAEKGYMDLAVEVNTPGGHSSNPRDHTSIGIISQFLSSYEADKFEVQLPEDSPMLNMFECVAEKAKISTKIKVLAKLARVNAAAKAFLLSKLSKLKLFEYTVRTAQAVDVIIGGDKYNALPRNTTAIINHRITIGDDFGTIINKALKHAEPIAIQHNLGLIVNNTEIIPPTSNGVIKLTGLSDTAILPAPITPIFDEKWNRFTGYMRTFYEREVYPEKFENSHYIISPTSMQGNTDTKYYWALTDHIYRSQPGITNLFEAGMHGNNEWVHIDSHLQVIAFYYNYLLGICM